jgi:hypothetical protein
MPGGGLFALVAYGAQNVLLSGNPDFTYFYKVYKKYTHFAEESVTFAMDGTQELSYDLPIQVRFKVQRIADLIRDMYFTFNLPDIYSKYIDLVENTTRNCQYEFRWARYIGCSIIQNAAFFIGGQKIQEMDGSYIIAKAQADLGNSIYNKWRILVGDVEELTDPAKGEYAGGYNHAGYPTVYPDPDGGNVNRPSIFGRTISVPIPFWFSESTFESLPLLALQYHECEVQITLRPINQLYQILDASGNLVRPGFKLQSLPMPTNPYYVQVTDASDQMIGNFLTDFGVPQPLIPTWQLQPRLQFTYVYLTDDERKEFATQTLQYLIRQVTPYQYPGLFQRQLVELYTHNPINRLFVVPRRSDSIEYRNEYANWSNWPFGTSPYVPPTTPYPPWVTNTYSSGRLIPVAGQQEILQTLQMFGDGNEIQEVKPITYFTRNVQWKYMAGVPDKNLIVYPFGLHSPNDQPDGSINSSRIRLLQIDLNPYPLLPTTNYLYDVTIYVENLNWVVISAGMGGLKYAL